MRRIIRLLLFVFPALVFSQNIQVDWTTYSPQELIEDILIDSDCIENVIVTNVVGGNFNGTDESFGYFDGNGSLFPFQNGIVLSTGKIINTEGPNNSLSDDDAPGWVGDDDLEDILNESNTTNATIIEFDFTSTSVATQISFRYLFSSEEYQENNPNTCVYSDLFGFLIRPSTSSEYKNIAVIPGTPIPVKVTTVRPDISTNCTALNEEYFGQFNDTSAPINMNGETTVLTAIADIIPNETYHVKLVIADHVNYRYDSAVFLEAGSFDLLTDLGDDFLIDDGTALCPNETYELDATLPGNNTYAWYKDGVLQQFETNSTYTITESGYYEVIVTLENSCISEGSITAEYDTTPAIKDAILIECDLDQDGITYYNLYDAQSDITNDDNSLAIVNFFYSQSDAEQNSNPIPNPNLFENDYPMQIVFARVENRSSCFNVSELQLDIATNSINIPIQEECSDGQNQGLAQFDLDQITASFSNQIPTTAIVSYYESENDAALEQNALSSPYTNTTLYRQDIFVKVIDGNTCYAISSVELYVNDAPSLIEDESVFYCTDTFPATITINAGLAVGNPIDYTYQWFLNNQNLELDTYTIEINQVGSYLVEVIDNTNQCLSTRTIEVLESNSAVIDDILVEETQQFSNTVTINTSGNGDYEYALNSIFGPFQDSAIFTEVPAGFHTVYVNDKNGCRVTTEEFAIVGFPNFFTPNNDGINDVWQIYGVNNEFNSAIEVHIFDRFGKLIKRLNSSLNYWDGFYDGTSMPSSDYWYTATLDDGTTYQGHFSLKR